MSEKPQKQLVDKRRYAWVMAGRTTLLSAALLCSMFGAYRVVLIIHYFERVSRLGHYRMSSTMLHVLFRTTLMTAGSYYLAYCLWKKERTVERVAPITKHNTSALPPEESLVRPSDLPPLHPQSELLRAAPQAQETPAAQLLRATTNRQED